MHACNAIALDQLLSVRDGEPVAVEIAGHVEQCAACARELKRLRNMRAALQSLPQLPPPAYDANALRVRARRSLVRTRWAAAAFAAGMAAVAVLTLLTISNRVATRTAARTAVNAIDHDIAQFDSHSDETLAALVIRSQELESRLQALPRSRIERGGTAMTVNALQNGIQWVDYQLSLADDLHLTDRQSAQLWEDRLRLMDTLVKVRYADAQRLADLQ